jgi:hypothetical protein
MYLQIGEDVYTTRRKWIADTCTRLGLVGDRSKGRHVTVDHVMKWHRPGENGYPVVIVVPSANVSYFAAPKVASSFWGRTLRILHPGRTKYSHTYKVSLKDSLMPRPIASIDSFKKATLKKSWKFSFVRNPYSKLFSAYVDKLVAPNPTYWAGIGKKAIAKFRANASATSLRCGHDATFAEVVQYVLFIDRFKNVRRDPHFSNTYDQILPCEYTYDVLGKMETFQNDAFYIMSKLGMKKEVEILNQTLKYEHALDAIKDSVYSPFEWKRDILKCISVDEALRRIWRKLQLRGIISPTVPYPLSDVESQNVTSDQFITIAGREIEIHQHSSKTTIKPQTAFYRTVPMDVMEQLGEYFYLDTVMFGYTPKPKEYFQTERLIQENILL